MKDLEYGNYKFIILDSHSKF